MRNLIGRILCWLGLHDWWMVGTSDIDHHAEFWFCTRCGRGEWQKRQEARNGNQ